MSAGSIPNCGDCIGLNLHPCAHVRCKVINIIAIIIIIIVVIVIFKLLLLLFILIVTVFISIYTIVLISVARLSSLLISFWASFDCFTSSFQLLNLYQSILTTFTWSISFDNPFMSYSYGIISETVRLRTEVKERYTTEVYKNKLAKL